MRCSTLYKSLTTAAITLPAALPGYPTSRLSRSIRQLETHLSARLINRSPRHFALTDAGHAFYGHCQQVIQASEAAQAAIARQHIEPQGTIRISCPTALLNFVVAGMISRYMARYPLGKSTDRQHQPRGRREREGLDIALLVKTPPFEDSSLVMKRLSRSPQVLVASPGLLASHGRPGGIDDLAGLPSLHWGAQASSYQWQLQGPAGQGATLRHQPRLVTDDVITIRRCALEHGGIAQLPLLVCFKDLQQGLLVPVLDDWQPQEAVVFALFPSRQGMLPSVRSLLDFLTDSFGDMDFPICRQATRPGATKTPASCAKVGRRVFGRPHQACSSSAACAGAANHCCRNATSARTRAGCGRRCG